MIIAQAVIGTAMNYVTKFDQAWTAANTPTGKPLTYFEKIQMSKHLPECLAFGMCDDPDCFHGTPICICDRLRDCEKRVRGEEQQRIESALKFVGQNDVAWELGIRERTLREAVQRVEALICADCLKHLMADDGYATCFFCYGAWEALAAIKGGKQ